MKKALQALQSVTYYIVLFWGAVVHVECSAEMQYFPNFNQNPFTGVLHILCDTLTNKQTQLPVGWPVQCKNGNM